ncbi:hypothetical protein PI124_g10091 [Phytophthora idaei]|nr:hypothetical protein PI125_g16915 [Phytophthora idaei]KAG3140859.1 hypothetical protein PI126_g15776 [Phytophthora idaei]KAG3245160.1 hypothetical protein PI124_g10091 [Phytophthora idaei]
MNVEDAAKLRKKDGVSKAVDLLWNAGVRIQREGGAVEQTGDVR